MILGQYASILINYCQFLVASVRGIALKCHHSDGSTNHPAYVIISRNN